MDPTGKKIRKNVNVIHDFFANEGLKYPKADLVKIEFPTPAILCNSAKSIKWLLKDEFDNITKPGLNDLTFRLLREFLGDNGVFVLRHGKSNKEEHKTWFKQRKVASLIFTKNNFMTTFHETFIEKSKTFVKTLEKNNNSVIDIQEMYFSFTMDSIEKFFFGTEVNTIAGGMSRYGI